MQVTETLNEGLKRGYAITVPATELEAKVSEKLEEARKDFQMKGFRKGKAPAALMKKMFGKSVLGEAMQESIDQAMREHFEATRRPAGAAARGEGDQRGLAGGPGRRGLDDLRGAAAGARGGVRRRSGSRSSSPRSTTRRWTRRWQNLAASAKDYEDRKKGSQGQGRRPGGHRLQGLGRRRAVRGRRRRGLSAGARLGQLHPRLRGAARRREGGRRARGKVDLPRGVRREAPRRQGCELRGDGEGGEGAEAGRDRRCAGRCASGPRRSTR